MCTRSAGLQPTLGLPSACRVVGNRRELRGHGFERTNGHAVVSCSPIAVPVWAGRLAVHIATLYRDHIGDWPPQQQRAGVAATAVSAAEQRAAGRLGRAELAAAGESLRSGMCCDEQCSVGVVETNDARKGSNERMWVRVTTAVLATSQAPSDRSLPLPMPLVRCEIQAAHSSAPAGATASTGDVISSQRQPTRQPAPSGGGSQLEIPTTLRQLPELAGPAAILAGMGASQPPAQPDNHVQKRRRLDVQRSLTALDFLPLRLQLPVSAKWSVAVACWGCILCRTESIIPRLMSPCCSIRSQVLDLLPPASSADVSNGSGPAASRRPSSASWTQPKSAGVNSPPLFKPLSAANTAAGSKQRGLRKRRQHSAPASRNNRQDASDGGVQAEPAAPAAGRPTAAASGGGDADTPSGDREEGQVILLSGSDSLCRLRHTSSWQDSR